MAIAIKRTRIGISLRAHRLPVGCNIIGIWQDYVSAISLQLVALPPELTRAAQALSPASV